LAGSRPLKNGNLPRQRKNPGRLCMRNTPRGLDFFASLHLTIFERPANFVFQRQVVFIATLFMTRPRPE
jgi:hypothetical protein